MDKQIFCSEHQSTMASCHRCADTIQGEVLVALKSQRKFHPHHFTCSLCDTSLLNAKYWEHSDRPFCQGCYSSTIHK